MREIISIHVGQAGIHLGNTCWELFALEHEILPDGTLINQNSDTSFFTSMFNNTNSFKYSPRSLFIDLETTEINKIKNYSGLYDENNFVTSNEDSSHLFARGFHSSGRKICEVYNEKVRKLAEKCDNLGGFIIYHSAGGGTGSGLTSHLLSNLSLNYPKCNSLLFSIYPSAHTLSSSVEFYNSILLTHNLLETDYISILLENSSAQKIGKNDLDIDENLNFRDINEIFAQSIASTTINLREDGCMLSNLSEFSENLIPYNRFKFLSSSYSPFYSVYKTCFNPNTVEITQSLIKPSSFLINYKHIGKYMAMSFLYRGDYVPKDIGPAIRVIKERKAIEFVDWCPTGFRCGINYKPIQVFPNSKITRSIRSAIGLYNNTSISQVFKRNLRKFDRMLNRKCFTHHFFEEGMEMWEFQDARENVGGLIEDYKEAELDCEIDNESN